MSVMCLLIFVVQVTIIILLLVSKVHVLKMKMPPLTSNYAILNSLRTYHKTFFRSVHCLLYSALYITGAEEIPPLGIPHDATLGFSGTNPYHTASTCAIQLTLPFKYATCESFRKYVFYAMVNHDGLVQHRQMNNVKQQYHYLIITDCCCVVTRYMTSL